MDFLNSILCMVQNILDVVFGFLNETLGLELTVPDVGCED